MFDTISKKGGTIPKQPSHVRYTHAGSSHGLKMSEANLLGVAFSFNICFNIACLASNYNVRGQSGDLTVSHRNDSIVPIICGILVLQQGVFSESCSLRWFMVFVNPERKVRSDRNGHNCWLLKSGLRGVQILYPSGLPWNRQIFVFMILQYSTHEKEPHWNHWTHPFEKCLGHHWSPRHCKPRLPFRMWDIVRLPFFSPVPAGSISNLGTLFLIPHSSESIDLMPTQKRLYLSLSTILSIVIVYLLSIFCLSLVYLLSTHHSLCIRFHIKDTRREKYGDENAKTLTSMTHMGGILEKRGGPWTLWSIWESGNLGMCPKWQKYCIMLCRATATAPTILDAPIWNPGPTNGSWRVSMGLCGCEEIIQTIRCQGTWRAPWTTTVKRWISAVTCWETNIPRPCSPLERWTLGGTHGGKYPQNKYEDWRLHKNVTG